MFKTVICQQNIKLVYKNQNLKPAFQHSVYFLYLIHKGYDTFLRLS